MRLLFATAALALLLPATASAASCEDKHPEFTGSAREAEFMGGGGVLGKRKLTVGEPVDELHGGGTYYVPKGSKLSVEIGGYTFKVSGGGVFIPQCDFGSTKLYFRLLEGKVTVSGPKFSGNPKGYVVTPEGSFLPLPGKPSYTVERVVTNSRKKTHSTVEADDDSAGMFVKFSSVIGKKVPCQAGKSVTLYLDGHYRNG